MELPISQQQGEMPIPLNTAYGDHNNIIIPSSNGPLPPTPHLDHGGPYNSKKTSSTVKYKECLKNHAAAMGGNATDGCGEFMPSGEEGTLEALTCSACTCHRNFHRKQTTDDDQPDHPPTSRPGLFLGHHPHYPKGGYFPPPHHPLLAPSRAPHHQMIMPYSIIGGGGGGASGGESDHEVEDVIRQHPPPHHHHHHHHQMGNNNSKKRFRTKFTQEQKDKMLGFAERVGWKIQKQEEAVVQQFCQEVGVKRRVLKVWMHNNKHSLAKRNNNTAANNNNNNSSSTSLQHQSSSIPHTQLQATS